MSIYDDDELDNMNAVRFETQLGTSKLRFRTPNGPGVEVTLDISPRPRPWDERKGPGTSGAFLVPQGVGLASAKLKIRYCATEKTERERLRAEHEDFLQIVASPLPGNPEKKFIINHPMAIAMQPPFVECVFLGDPPLVHDKTTDEDSIEFELKESRKQAPTISSTTAPGGATREGQSIDAHEAEKKEKLAQLETLAVDAGLIKP